MKKGKCPNRRQKLLLAKRKLNPDNWLVCKTLPNQLYIKHKVSGAIKIVEMGGGLCG